MSFHGERRSDAEHDQDPHDQASVPKESVDHEPLLSSWFLATVFPGYQASFGRSNAASARQRLMRRLYPTEGVMRSNNKEYRQRNHRPSCEHGNPLQHRDIMTRICAQDKSDQPSQA